MTDDLLARRDALRAELAALTGPARTRPLLELGQLCAHLHQRAGITSPAARPYLLEAIEALDEAYDRLDPGDANRVRCGTTLGMLLGGKLLAEPPRAQDPERDRAIALVGEALTTGAIGPVQRMTAHMVVGVLLVMRTMSRMQDPTRLMGAINGATPPEDLADLDSGLEHLAVVRVDPTAPAEARKMAETLTTMAEALRGLLGGFGGGPAGADLGTMMEALSTLQNLQKDNFGLRMPQVLPEGAFGPIVTDQPVVDRPVAVFPGAPLDEEPVAPPEPAPRTDVEGLRDSVRKLLTGGGDLLETLAGLLRAGEAPPWIDDFVAATGSVVYAEADSEDEADAEDEDDATPTGLDHLLHAAALYLRGLRDTGGWGEEEDEADGDTAAATESVLAAAATLPDAQPDAVPTLVFLAGLCSEAAVAGVAERLTGLRAAVRALGAESLLLPEPAEGLALNAASGRIEPCDAPGDGSVVVGPEAPGISGHWFASLSQLLDVAARKLRPVTADPVFVVNPRGDREAATMQAMALRRLLYPRSTGLGQVVENVDGAGTANEVRRSMGASLLHLDCGVSAAGMLELADGGELDVAELTASAGAAGMKGPAGSAEMSGPAGPAGMSGPAGSASSPELEGGLAILPPGRFHPLADQLLAAGFAGVIGWAGPVPDPLAALLVFVVHQELAESGGTPAEAVRRARRWLLDPDRDRERLPALLTGYADRLNATPGTDLAVVAATLVYRGP
ncbi:CHAT domain-containing protein [Catenulispora subtropica]|uniref:CHAT domain-containing protein n=1 Tax=Catenulispora subtropica TaxID=450798 RepID=A0ABN2T1V6_9ACTN